MRTSGEYRRARFGHRGTTAVFVCAVLACASTACHRRSTVPSTALPSAAADSFAKDSVVRSTALLPRIPRDASRFEIDAVDDSTAKFRPREADWIREGMVAYAVDPLHRDALVARLRITEVHAVMITALVTSQVTRVTPAHVVLLLEPRPTWWKTRRFWIAASAGALLGGALGASIPH